MIYGFDTLAMNDKTLRLVLRSQSYSQDSQPQVPSQVPPSLNLIHCLLLGGGGKPVAPYEVEEPFD